MAQQILPSNTFTTAKWIVSATSSDGTHTTIAGALTSASSGDTIFIRPGTYTENLTLKAGVNLTAYDDSITPNVVILGKLTATFAGTCTVSGIQLKTNTDNFLAVTGSAATIVWLVNCFLNCSNATGITYSVANTSAQIKILNCQGDIGTTGITVFTNTSTGGMLFQYTRFENNGLSTTASTTSQGPVSFDYCNIKFALTSSSSGSFGNSFSYMYLGNTNTTCVTLAGTGAFNSVQSYYESGTASALSIGTGTTSTVNKCVVSSSNTNAITGAGTINYSDITFTGTSSLINTTTQTYNYTQLGKSMAFGQPSFLAEKSATSNNVTGNSTVYTYICDTEVYDIGSNYNNATGIFTAPVTGKYMFTGNTTIIGCTIATNLASFLTTSNRTYKTNFIRAAGSANLVLSFVQMCDLDAADTCTFQIQVSGEAADTADLYGDGTTTGTWNSGILLS
jgi:hypothetical protein